MRAITGIILAGGASRRLGQDKASMPWGKTTLIGHLVHELLPVLQPLIVVGSPKNPLPELPGSVEVTCDLKAYEGPLAGFARGLTLAPVQQPVFLTGCDFPLIQSKIINYLNQLLGDYDVVLPMIDGISQPLAALYRPTVIDEVSKALEQGCHSMHELLQRLKCYHISQHVWKLFDPDAKMLTNINTIQDYHAAQQTYFAGTG